MRIVIKHGRKRLAICPECDCQFTFEKEDIHYGPQQDYYEEVVCPDCGNSINLIEKGEK